MKKYNPKDYILLHCRVCNEDVKCFKKDRGNFIPFAPCPHIAYKGIVEVD